MNIKNKSVEVTSWQKLLEIISNYVGQGYYYIHVSYLSLAKKDKWDNITLKLLTKYKADITKDQRYQRKTKGLANFFVLRWEHVLVILHTEGKIIVSDELKHTLLSRKKLRDSVKAVSEMKHVFNPKQLELYQLTYDDDFSDVRQTPVFLKTSDLVSFRVQRIPKEFREKIDPKEKQKGKKGKILNRKVQTTIYLDNQFVKDKKAELAELLEKKAKNRVISSFKMLNGFPAHRGITLQKQEIKKFVLSEAKKNGVKILSRELFINNNRDTTGSIFKN